MLVNQRIIWKDNTTLTDVSVELNDLTAGTVTLPIVASEDKIYIGSDLPFNHRHFVVTSANAVVSSVSVEIWNGNAWVSAVDVVDQTKVAGATLAQSGIISWNTERTSHWGMEDKTADISDLATLNIYDMYWVRITFSANLTSTTALGYVGHKFATDSDLNSHGYADINTSSVKAAYTTGKTTWDDQHIVAAEQIVKYLRQKRVVDSKNQIWNWEQFNEAAVHKVAEIIYGSFNDDYEDQRKLAEARYMKAINLGIFEVDRNKNGRLDTQEKLQFFGLVRK